MVWNGPLRSAMAFGSFRITSLKAPSFQMRPFQMRVTVSSKRPRAFGTRPLSASSRRASEAIRQPETSVPYGGIPSPSRKPNGELNVDITLEPIRNGGAMRRYRLHGGTLPAPTGNVPLPRGEEPRDGLALVVQFFIDAAERVEVDQAGLGAPNVISQRGARGYAHGGQQLGCQNLRNGCGLLLGVQLALVRDVGEQGPGDPDALRMRRAASTVEGTGFRLPAAGSPVEVGEERTL